MADTWSNYVKALGSILNYRDLFWLNGTQLFTTTKRPVQKLYTFQIIAEDGIYIRPVFKFIVALLRPISLEDSDIM